eukprot:GHVN01087162.1.p1 GENE.GHVN01087162.1~~GHVN01087162.1.p1  ORF type:complete len:429 (-),score=89.46 GHVN01087162.1:263-1447(-)
MSSSGHAAHLCVCGAKVTVEAGHAAFMALTSVVWLFQDRGERSLLPSMSVWIPPSSLAVASLLLAVSWFAPLPYIRECRRRGSARATLTGPYFYSEIFPTVALAILGFILLWIAIVAELLLLKALRTPTTETYSLTVGFTFVLSVFVGLTLLCYGLLVRYDSSLYYISIGGFLLAVIFICGLRDLMLVGQSVSEIMGVVSAFVSAGIASCCFVSFIHLQHYSTVLTKDEQVYRYTETITLAMCSFMLALVSLHIGSSEVGREIVLLDRIPTVLTPFDILLFASTGLCLSVHSITHWLLHLEEVKVGSPESRLLEAASPLSLGGLPGEAHPDMLLHRHTHTTSTTPITSLTSSAPTTSLTSTTHTTSFTSTTPTTSITSIPTLACLCRVTVGFHL